VDVGLLRQLIGALRLAAVVVRDTEVIRNAAEHAQHDGQLLLREEIDLQVQVIAVVTRETPTTGAPRNGVRWIVAVMLLALVVTSVAVGRSLIPRTVPTLAPALPMRTFNIQHSTSNIQIPSALSVEC